VAVADAKGGGRRFSLEEMSRTVTEMQASGRGAEAIEMLLAALDSVHDHNRRLELLVLKLKRQGHRSKSEGVSAEQLQLLYEELQKQGGPDSPADVGALTKQHEEVTKEIQAAEEERKKKRKPRDGRRPRTAPADSPEWELSGADKQVHVVDLAEAERSCTTCGDPMTAFAQGERTIRLEWVPGHFVEHEYELKKYACGRCKDAVVTPPAPPQVLPRSQVTAGVLAQLLVA
jgi:transposase